MKAINKSVLGVGALILFAGVMQLLIENHIPGFNEFNPEEHSLWRGDHADNETLQLSDEHHYQIYIHRDGNINSISATNSLGDNLLSVNQCDSIHGIDSERCEKDWVEYGEFGMNDCPCDFSLNSSAEIIITKYETRHGGWNSFFYGVLTILLGIIVLAAGGVSTLFNKDKEVELQQVNPPIDNQHGIE